eukprot:CAMPEP_0195061322 /NCGR_PEP_ID=MMETSP0448-20130528/8302_1 /TAXON_ID=66468 /ORGANISM="Heterocapsa triquestra, Strain CCMP 448" /LENGTH=508 /DNA_ID=CAMNT_0040091873 /DNA_START=169 /DNA_END=1693 /DNA_ORIENTATION=+
MARKRRGAVGRWVTSDDLQRLQDASEVRQQLDVVGAVSDRLGERPRQALRGLRRVDLVLEDLEGALDVGRAAADRAREVAGQDLLEVPLAERVHPVAHVLANLATVHEGVAHGPHDPLAHHRAEGLRRLKDTSAVGAEEEREQRVALPAPAKQLVVARRSGLGLSLLRVAHGVARAAPVGGSDKVQHNVVVRSPEVDELFAVEHRRRLLGHVDQGIGADQGLCPSVEERALRRAVAEAKPILGAEDLLVNLGRPGYVAILVFQLACREDAEEGTWQVNGEGPLLGHGVNLRVRKTARERADEDLVLVLRRAEHNVLDGAAQLADELQALLGWCHRVVDPQTAALEADDCHPVVDRDVGEALLLLEGPHVVVHLCPHGATRKERPEREGEACDVQVPLPLRGHCLLAAAAHRHAAPSPATLHAASPSGADAPLNSRLERQREAGSRDHGQGRGRGQAARAVQEAAAGGAWSPLSNPATPAGGTAALGSGTAGFRTSKREAIARRRHCGS